MLYTINVRSPEKYYRYTTVLGIYLLNVCCLVAVKVSFQVLPGRGDFSATFQQQMHGSVVLTALRPHLTDRNTGISYSFPKFVGSWVLLTVPRYNIERLY